MLVRCSLKNYVLRNTAVIIVYGEPMELPRCGAEKICGRALTNKPDIDGGMFATFSETMDFKDELKR